MLMPVPATTAMVMMLLLLLRHYPKLFTNNRSNTTTTTTSLLLDSQLSNSSHRTTSSLIQQHCHYERSVSVCVPRYNRGLPLQHEDDQSPRSQLSTLSTSCRRRTTTSLIQQHPTTTTTSEHVRTLYSEIQEAESVRTEAELASPQSLLRWISVFTVPGLAGECGPVWVFLHVSS